MADEEGPSGFYGDAAAADEDGTATDSIDDGGGGGGGDGIIGSVTGGISGWGDLTLPDTLQSFLSNPQGFIIGAVATAILEGIFGIVTTGINMLIRVFLGTNAGEFNAPRETLGLADVPVYAVDQFLRIGGYASTAILNAIESLNEPVFALASSAGPATPLIVTTVVVVEVIIVLVLLQRLVYVVADLLQLGGLTE